MSRSKAPFSVVCVKFLYNPLLIDRVTLLCRPFIKSVLQGFLPGLALKLFLIFLPALLMMMSKFEGYEAISALERRSASRYYIFNFVNVFLGSIIAGSAFEQLYTYLHSSAGKYATKTLCLHILVYVQDALIYVHTYKLNTVSLMILTLQCC